MKHIKTFEIVTTRFNEPQTEEPTEFEFGDIVRFKSDANVSDGIKKSIYQVEAAVPGKSKLVNLEDSDYLGWIRNVNLELLSDEEIAQLNK